MKTILFIKEGQTPEESFEGRVVVDIVDNLSEMEKPGFDRMMSIMELNLSDYAISQGLDFQLKEYSYQTLLSVGMGVPCDKIEVYDYSTSSSIVVYTKKEIKAVDDTATATGSTGGTNVVNVLDNDTYDGSTATVGDVLLTVVSNDDDEKLTLNPDGSVDVEASTSEGEYEIVYKICDIMNPANCDTATLTLTVE